MYEAIIREIVALIRNREINSNIAIFNIVMTVTSTHSPMNLEEAINLWLQYKREIIRINTECNDDTEFVVKVLQHLKFPNQEKESRCQYEWSARNFIIGLKSGEMMCQSYTEYVLAAAEEADRPAIIPLDLPGHVMIAIIDTTQVIPMSSQQDIDETLNIFPKAKHIRNILEIFGTEKYFKQFTQLHPVIVAVDAGFEGNENGFCLKLIPDRMNTFSNLCSDTCFKYSMNSPAFATGQISVWNHIDQLISHVNMRSNLHSTRRHFDFCVVAMLYDLDYKKFEWFSTFLNHPNNSKVINEVNSIMCEINTQYQTFQLARNTKSVITRMFFPPASYYKSQRHHCTHIDLSVLYQGLQYKVFEV